MKRLLLRGQEWDQSTQPPLPGVLADPSLPAAGAQTELGTLVRGEFGCGQGVSLFTPRREAARGRTL